MHRELQFHHIGLACRDMAQDRRDHESLGYRSEGEAFEDPLQRIRGLFMTLGTMRVELLEPLDETSPLMDYLKRGIKIYHQCFECDDIASAIEDLQAHGRGWFRPRSRPWRSIIVGSRFCCCRAGC